MKFATMQFLIIALQCSLIVLSAPLAELKFCGKDLADTLAEVCSGRGYNAFWSDVRSTFNERRPKRGIVDECCRRYCTWSTLEAYCSPPSSPTPNNDDLSVRKRSGVKDKVKVNDEKAVMQEASRLAYRLPEIEDISEQTRHHQRKLFAHTDSDIIWPGKTRTYGSQYKTNRNHVLREPYVNNKVKRNDPPSGIPSLESHILNHLVKDMPMNEALLETEEILSQLNDPNRGKERIRHPRTHSSRVIRLKDSSQIGTVSPYFRGRTLVFPTSRKNRLIRH